MRRIVRPLCLFGIIQIVFFLSTGFSVRAQTTPAPSPTPATQASASLEKEFFKNILHDQKVIWTAPLHLGRTDAKWMAPSAIGLMALFTTDRITGDEMSEFDRQVKASKIASYGGSTVGVAAVASTFYIVGRTKKDARARETGILSAEAIVDSGIVVTALKGVTQRARPQAGIERSEFFDGGNSFPSGHSIEAWSVATVIANEYHDNRLVQIGAYGIATAVGLARFTGHKHYISDVVVGSALGYGIGRYVYHAHHRRDASSASVDEDEPLKTSSWPAITPLYSHQARQYGVALTWNF